LVQILILLLQYQSPLSSLQQNRKKAQAAAHRSQLAAQQLVAAQPMKLFPRKMQPKISFHILFLSLRKAKQDFQISAMPTGLKTRYPLWQAQES
jgi:hypothetical protein